jgi:hypothetical protein
MSKRLEITGQRFGRLAVIGFAKIDGRRRAHWLCRCDCGNEVVVRGQSLRSGDTQSCGCLQQFANLKHGHRRSHSPSPEYISWCSMLTRCTNPKATGFANWGGRGITVCERWLHSFANFLADMGLKPSPDLSLDRIDNDGNYEPGNCRWATPEEQNNNQRPRRAA